MYISDLVVIKIHVRIQRHRTYGYVHRVLAAGSEYPTTLVEFSCRHTTVASAFVQSASAITPSVPAKVILRSSLMPYQSTRLML